MKMDEMDLDKIMGVVGIGLTVVGALLTGISKNNRIEKEVHKLAEKDMQREASKAVEKEIERRVKK